MTEFSGPVLSASGVCKSYGPIRVLHNVSISVAPGTIVSLVGDNGAGKSTLIKILTGAVQPDDAEIRVAGEPMAFRKPTDAQRVGIAAIYQDLALFNNLDVSENVFAGREMTRRFLGVHFLRRRAMSREAHAVLRDLGIITLNRNAGSAGQLSGGQRQMIAVARAIGMNARVLILDEPTAALGLREAAILLDQVRRLRDLGLGIILITHRLPDAIELSDKIIVLKGGAVQGELFPPSCSLEDVADLIVRGSAT